MGATSSIGASVSLGTCASRAATGADCYTRKAGIDSSLVKLNTETWGTGFEVKAGASFGVENKLARDPTDLQPVSVEPSVSAFQPTVTLTLVPFKVKLQKGAVGAKVSSPEIQTGKPAPQGQMDASLTVSGEKKGAKIGAGVSPSGPTKDAGYARKEARPIKGKDERGEEETIGTFQSYLTVGRETFKLKNELAPPIDSPFAGVPIGHEIPSKIAVKGGFRDIPVGEHLFFNVEGGYGRFGPTTGDVGYSFLGSARLRLKKWMELSFGLEKTHQEAPVEPELDKFFTAEGESNVSPAYYASLSLGQAALYGGYVTRTIEFSKFDSAAAPEQIRDAEQERTMIYGAASWKRLWVMHGVQTFRRRGTDFDNPEDMIPDTPIDADGRLTSLGYTHPFPLGFSLSAVVFFQSTEGDGIASFSNNGFYAALGWSGMKDFPW